MGTRKSPKAKASKPDAAGRAPAAKPKATRSKNTPAPEPETASSASSVTAKAGRNRAVDDDDPNAELRVAMIAHAAYLRAEKRGFAPGKELDDWLAAAADVDAQLAKRGPH